MIHIGGSLLQWITAMPRGCSSDIQEIYKAVAGTQLYKLGTFRLAFEAATQDCYVKFNHLLYVMHLKHNVVDFTETEWNT